MTTKYTEDIFIYPTLATNCMQFLIAHEGFEPIAYQCAANKWSIGYGNTFDPFTDAPVKPEDKITRDTAYKWLEQYLQRFIWPVLNRYSIRSAKYLGEQKSNSKMPDNVYIALSSFFYNVGIGTLNINKQLKKEIIAHNWEAVIQIMQKYNKITVNNKKVVNNGLVNRRNAEVQLMLKGT